MAFILLVFIEAWHNALFHSFVHTATPHPKVALLASHHNRQSFLDLISFALRHHTTSTKDPTLSLIYQSPQYNSIMFLVKHDCRTLSQDQQPHCLPAHMFWPMLIFASVVLLVDILIIGACLLKYRRRKNIYSDPSA